MVRGFTFIASVPSFVLLLVLLLLFSMAGNAVAGLRRRRTIHPFFVRSIPRRFSRTRVLSAESLKSPRHRLRSHLPSLGFSILPTLPLVFPLHAIAMHFFSRELRSDRKDEVRRVLRDGFLYIRAGVCAFRSLPNGRRDGATSCVRFRYRKVEKKNEKKKEK